MVTKTVFTTAQLRYSSQNVKSSACSLATCYPQTEADKPWKVMQDPTRVAPTFSFALTSNAPSLALQHGTKQSSFMLCTQESAHIETSSFLLFCDKDFIYSLWTFFTILLPRFSYNFFPWLFLEFMYLCTCSYFQQKPISELLPSKPGLEPSSELPATSVPALIMPLITLLLGDNFSVCISASSSFKSLKAYSLYLSISQPREWAWLVVYLLI